MCERLRQSITTAKKYGVPRSQIVMIQDRVRQKLCYKIRIAGKNCRDREAWLPPDDRDSRKGSSGASLAKNGETCSVEERIWATEPLLAASILEWHTVVRVHDVAE